MIVFWVVLHVSYNSLENPIGIETQTQFVRRIKTNQLQLIRKPDRD